MDSRPSFRTGDPSHQLPVHQLASVPVRGVGDWIGSDSVSWLGRRAWFEAHCASQGVRSIPLTVSLGLNHWPTDALGTDDLDPGSRPRSQRPHRGFKLPVISFAGHPSRDPFDRNSVGWRRRLRRLRATSRKSPPSASASAPSLASTDPTRTGSASCPTHGRAGSFALRCRHRARPGAG